jgi:thiosulfate dehydrogenase
MRAMFRFAALMVAVSGCTISAKDYGRQLLDDSSVSNAQSNAFRCTTCHELLATPQHIRPGYTLYDVVNRASWWGGFEITLLDSINQCVVNFMRGQPLQPGDEQARSILVYLESISPDASAPARPITIVQNIVDVPSGDPAMGKQIYDDGCANCHGAPHTGKGRISDKASLVPDDSIMAHGTDPVMGARPVLIEKTRHGKFFMVGGNMAPYSLEVLTDMQLGALLGYLEQFGLPPSVSP